MSRPSYSEYVKHCLRYYCRNLNPGEFKNLVDKANWTACERVLKEYSERDVQIIIMVYSERDTLADNVYKASSVFKLNQSIIWDMLKDVDYKIAKRRGLV